MPTGRFAPSPSGRLHLGNLRTALVAWMFARYDDAKFDLRFEDLDPAAIRPEHYQTQTEDLAALGLSWDENPIRQSKRLDHYQAAIDRLKAGDMVYPCFCSRREVREAAQAPNRPHAGYSYPGTCRHLTTEERAVRGQWGRQPALRLKSKNRVVSFEDRLAGQVEFEVDDFVVQRSDKTPAYHVACVVDDSAQAIDLVVRADDLLDSAARQILLFETLGLTAPSYAHVPLVLAKSGDRLAKSDGAVTLPDRTELGETASQVLAFLGASLGLCARAEEVDSAVLLARFDPDRLPSGPFTISD